MLKLMVPEEISPASAGNSEIEAPRPHALDATRIIVATAGAPLAGTPLAAIAASEIRASETKAAASYDQAAELAGGGPAPNPTEPQSTGVLPSPPGIGFEAAAPIPPAPASARSARSAKPADRQQFWLPAVLFGLTCLSTYAAGAIWSDPFASSSEPGSFVLALVDNARHGLAYMAAVMSILLAHEMGHFLQAVRYRTPASLPFFLPMPLTPLGTMGAVIALRGSQANRRELFDIGLTGPLAGLLLALPLAWIGIRTAEIAPIGGDWGLSFGDPLVFKLMVAWLRPDLPAGSHLVSHANPLVMASWVGMLITGLNMLPIGQLDGGHVTYALLGKRAHWLARLMVLVAFVFIVVARQYGWSLMLGLVVFFGIRHPPTTNDRAVLGRWRTALGWASLAIPIFCLTPFPVVPN
ncbi:MAG TPA: site-2 protease family protein [Pirellulales bacterium]|nr:site-2 protease family protein [Pirellulales bacterium]